MVPAQVLGASRSLDTEWEGRQAGRKEEQVTSGGSFDCQPAVREMIRPSAGVLPKGAVFQPQQTGQGQFAGCGHT